MMKKNNGNLNGMTLVETLVAIFLFTLGMAGFTLLFAKTWKVNSSILEEGNITRETASALQDTIKSLRKIKQADDGSYPIASVGNYDLVVYLDDDNDGVVERVHYYLDNSQNFKKGVTKPTGNVYPSGDQTVSTIASYVTNTSSQPIFYYYDKGYPVDSTAPLTNPATTDVRLIKIRLWVNIKPMTAPDNINVESFVEFRNLNENY